MSGGIPGVRWPVGATQEPLVGCYAVVGYSVHRYTCIVWVTGEVGGTNYSDPGSPSVGEGVSSTSP